MSVTSDLLAEFKENASNASYHHADDTGREWGEARAYEDRCKEIWNAADDGLKAEIRAIAGSYLISFWQWGK